jgi:hypothetical protein
LVASGETWRSRCDDATEPGVTPAYPTLASEFETISDSPHFHRMDLASARRLQPDLRHRNANQRKRHVVATDKHEGQRVRLRADAPTGSYVDSFLTEEQHRDGVEGVVVSVATEGGRVVYDVKLENVPKPHRVAALHCDLIEDGIGKRTRFSWWR